MKKTLLIFIGLCILAVSPAWAAQSTIAIRDTSYCALSLAYGLPLSMLTNSIITIAPFLLSFIIIFVATQAEKFHDRAALIKPLLQHRIFFWAVTWLILGAGFFYSYMAAFSTEAYFRVDTASLDRASKKQNDFFVAAAIYLSFYLFACQYVYALFCYKKERPLPTLFRRIPAKHVKAALRFISLLSLFPVLYAIGLAALFFYTVLSCR